MTEDDGLYIVSISLHGLVRGKGMELGHDSDTGGQIKYVVEHAEALAKRSDVDRVDLITRQIFDPELSPDYGESREELSPKANIIRIPFGPKRYLRKEVLWPYLDSFVDNILKYLRSIGRSPDIVHGHYADAGYVGAHLANLLDIPLIFTGHSLGRLKQRRLLDQGMTKEAVEKRYNMTQRVEAEEMALDNASFVVASTVQEVEEQYKQYDSYHPKRMTVIPPGVNLDRFFVPSKKVPETAPNITRDIVRFLRIPWKPMILAIARPDVKKNFSTLIRAYGESHYLRENANLVLFPGIRDNIANLEKGSQSVLNEILYLIDYYDLYGSVAYPKSHDPDEISEIYRLAARTKGIFVNPAFIEPFGLTVLEAGASGLPVVVTQSGGPQEIIDKCKNGILIDPSDQYQLGKAMELTLQDKNQWSQWSKSGVTGVRKYYSWTSHANRYVQAVKRVIHKTKKEGRIGPRVKSKLTTIDRMLVCDIDDTITGDQESLDHLHSLLDQAGHHIGFGLATGRNLKLTQKALKEWNIPIPNLTITSVGSEIYYGSNMVEDRSWKRHIQYRWKPEAIRDAMKGLPGIKLQPKDSQGLFKISYYIDPTKAPTKFQIQRHLRRSDLYATVVHSHGQFLDLLPIRASKGMALRYFAIKRGIPIERFVVAGNSGNDEEMLTGNTLGVVVGNHTQELEKLRGRSNIYFAHAHFSSGVLEGLDYWNFFGQLKPLERDEIITLQGSHQGNDFVIQTLLVNTPDNRLKID